MRIAISEPIVNDSIMERNMSRTPPYEDNFVPFKTHVGSEVYVTKLIGSHFERTKCCISSTEYVGCKPSPLPRPEIKSRKPPWLSAPWYLRYEPGSGQIVVCCDWKVAPCELKAMFFQAMHDPNVETAAEEGRHTDKDIYNWTGDWAGGREWTGQQSKPRGDDLFL